MNIPIGYNQFQSMLRRVAKFRENQLRGVEKSVHGKKFNNIYQSSLSLKRYAGDCITRQ